MRTRARSVLFLIIFIAVLWFVLDRVRVVVFVQASPWALLAFVLVTSVIIFLVVDHFLRRSR